MKRKPNNMDQVMHILKCNEFNMLKKEVEEFGQHIKNLDIKNKILEHSVEILKDPNVWTYDCFIFVKFN